MKAFHWTYVATRSKRRIEKENFLSSSLKIIWIIAFAFRHWCYLFSVDHYSWNGCKDFIAANFPEHIPIAIFSSFLFDLNQSFEFRRESDYESTDWIENELPSKKLYRLWQRRLRLANHPRIRRLDRSLAIFSCLISTNRIVTFQNLKAPVLPFCLSSSVILHARSRLIAAKLNPLS